MIDYLKRVFETYKEYGVSYFMIDFIYAGALEGKRHDDIDGITTYRAALDLIRQWIGPEALLQGCGAPMFPSIGKVDSMRVGPDTAPTYEAPLGDYA